MRNRKVIKAAPRIGTTLSLIVFFWLTAVGDVSADEAPNPEPTWCKAQKDENAVLRNFGGARFANPPEISSRDGVLKYYLIVDYAKNTVGGCQTFLRSYNYHLVGETLRAKPGDTLKIKLMNNLPVATAETLPQQPPPQEHSGQFNFNITNLHTHGLHVSPKDKGDKKGDNVFVEVPPQGEADYEIKIPDNHVAGTFWYHAHLHGATAIQVASGMAGALIQIYDDHGLVKS